MSNIKFTMKDLDGTVMPYTSFVISTSASANAASFTTNLNGEATVTLAAVSTPYYISKQDGTTESVIAYKFFVPDTTYTLDAELLYVDMGKISKDKNDKSIAALIEAKVVAVNAANRALQVVSLLGDKQPTLVSGTNIKTINNLSILGSGNIDIASGGAATAASVAFTPTGNISATNVQLALVELDSEKQSTLVSGTSIKTINSSSLLGAGDVVLQAPLVSGTTIKTINTNSLLGSGNLSVQDTLVSGTNIKTINNASILGSGNISISGGAGGTGDVVGPAVSVYTGIAEFADTSGKLLRSTHYSVAQLVASIAEKAPSTHTHANATPSTAGFMSALDKTKLDTMSGGGGTGGGGDVFGPPSSVYTGIAEFADTSGKLLRTTNVSVAQLNLAIDAKAEASHTHPVVTPSAPGLMTPADKVKLDSISGGAGGTAPAKLRIVVIGDSMSAQQNALGQAWPGLLEDSIRANGVDVEVHNLSINGMSFGNVNSEVSFNGTATMQARAISLNPDIVIVALGANDAVTGTRTTATQAATVTAMTNAATSLFSALRSALPSAVILYASQTTWDRTHKPNPNSIGLLSREAPGLYHQRTTSGLAAGMVSPQMMPLSLTADENSRFAGFYLADNAIRALGTHNGVLELDMWRINRLGCLGADNTHANAAGHRLANAAVYGGLRANTAAMSKLVSLGHQLVPSWNDLTQVFNTYMVDSGGAWVERNNLPVGDLHLSRHIVDAGSIRPVTWFYPSGGQVTTNVLNLVEHAVFTGTGTGLVPRALVYESNNGVTWTATECYTDAFGNVSLSYSHQSLSSTVPVSFTFYLRAGEEVFGPFPLTVAARTAPSGVTGPESATADGLATYNGTTGKLLANSGRTIAQLDADIGGKQATLVSGSNLKTVNNTSLLGAGDLATSSVVHTAAISPQTLSGLDMTLASFSVATTGIYAVSWSIGGTMSSAAGMFTRLRLSSGANAATGSSLTVASGTSVYGTSTGCWVGALPAGTHSILGSVSASSFNVSPTNAASQVTVIKL